VDLVHKTAIKEKWQKVKVHIDKIVKGVFEMRPVQRGLYQGHGDGFHVRFLGPTGCGKSHGVKSHAAYQMDVHGVQKTIVAVPQTIGGKSYRNAKIRYPDGTIREWKIAPKDFMTSPDTPTKNKTNGVKNFLRSKSSTRKNAICTHAAFVAAFSELSEKEKLELFSNVRIWVDECHHLCSKSNGEWTEFNKLAVVVAELMEKVPSCRIGMVTATYSRGDLHDILPDYLAERFEKFDYSWAEYFSTLEHLETFEYKFSMYGRCEGAYAPAEAIAQIHYEKPAKTIIHIPYVNSRCSHGKHYEVRNILKALGRDENGKIKFEEDEKGVLTVIDREGRRLKVLNLVSEKNRPAKKRYVEALDLPDDLDIIIALGMFKESADWVHAERSVIIGYRNSVTEVMQTIGRLTRDAPGKKHIEIYHLIQELLNVESEGFEDNLNKFVLALFGVMLLEDVFHPAKVKSRSSESNGDGEKRVSPFTEAVPKYKRREFLDRVFQKMAAECRSIEDGDVAKEYYEKKHVKFVKGLLEEFGCNTSTHEAIAEQVWRMFAKWRLYVEGLNVDDIDLKLLKRINPMVGILRFVTGRHDIDSFEKIRKAFANRRFLPFEEAHEFVMKLGFKKQKDWQDYSSSGKKPDLGCL